MEWSSLITQFRAMKVHKALLSLPKGKAPGPNGFHAQFYKHFWLAISQLIMDAFSTCNSSYTIPISWSSACILSPTENGIPQRHQALQTNLALQRPL